MWSGTDKHKDALNTGDFLSGIYMIGIKKLFSLGVRLRPLIAYTSSRDIINQNE